MIDFQHEAERRKTTKHHATIELFRVAHGWLAGWCN
jgi:hypothetical protein